MYCSETFILAIIILSYLCINKTDLILDISFLGRVPYISN